MNINCYYCPKTMIKLTRILGHKRTWNLIYFLVFRWFHADSNTNRGKKDSCPTPRKTQHSPQTKLDHPKCPKLLNNHCGTSNGRKISNLQDQSKSSNNQINIIQANSNENISPDISEIQSINNTLSAPMDEKQKMLLLKIANNSIAAASTIAENDCGNVSWSFFGVPIPTYLLVY